MRVLVAMSGGVDSSVAAALLVREGHEVVGVTMRLWGGDSDSGCCSVADVDDARRVAQQLDIDHLVFNFSDDFDRHVVAPYVEAHAAGLTPNPCIECNRHLKFDRLSERAALLGFDAVATGHHARVVPGADGRAELRRGADRAKDQSYVVHVTTADELARTSMPVGHLRKDEVRRIAAEMGLRTASKPDSQDVCFITRGDGGRSGREVFLGSRIPFRPAQVVDTDGRTLGEVPAVELVTLGQRRGLGTGGGGRRFVVDIDHAGATVVVGDESLLLRDHVRAVRPVWHGWTPSPGDERRVLVQCSAHGEPRPATAHVLADEVLIDWESPERVVSPGQSVVLYDLDDDLVLGGGLAAPSAP